MFQNKDFFYEYLGWVYIEKKTITTKQQSKITMWNMIKKKNRYTYSYYTDKIKISAMNRIVLQIDISS